jgi:hypothetical protein
MNAMQSIKVGTLALAASLALGGCAAVGDAWEMGRTGAAANDHIMLVRQEPPTLGYRRLVSQSGVYPDLGEFLTQRGEPDFLAETNSSERHYLILYYLDKREAFSCRTRAPRTREVEFAGPYPITDREYQTLSGYKRQGTPRPDN